MGTHYEQLTPEERATIMVMKANNILSPKLCDSGDNYLDTHRTA